MAARRVRGVAAVAGLSLVAVLTTAVATAPPAVALPGSVSFFGTGFGAIPEGGPQCSPSPGAPRDVTFVVSGMPARRVDDVRASVTMTSPWVGDLTVTLIAPNGAAKVLFGRTGAKIAASPGDASNLGGHYDFADDAAGDWWAAAASATSDELIPFGSYRSSELGGAGATGAQTKITAAFAALTDPNGTWTVRITDGCLGDAAAVTSGVLQLRSGPDCAVQETSLTSAQGSLSADDVVIGMATTASSLADQALDQAGRAVRKAGTALKKAKKALRTAEAGGRAAAVGLAKKQLRGAKKVLKAARAGQKAADRKAGAAHQQLSTAQGARPGLQSALVAAQGVVDICRAGG